VIAGVTSQTRFNQPSLIENAELPDVPALRGAVEQIDLNFALILIADSGIRRED
jgi:hypothetical protein